MQRHMNVHAHALLVEDCSAPRTGCGSSGLRETELGRPGRCSGVPTLPSPSNQSSRSRSRSARVASVPIRMGFKKSCPQPAPMHGATSWQMPLLTAAATLRDARGEQRQTALVELACAGIASEVLAHEVTH